MKEEIKGKYACDIKKGTIDPKLIFHLNKRNNKEMLVSVCVEGYGRMDLWFKPEDFVYLGAMIEVMDKHHWRSLPEDPLVNDERLLLEDQPEREFVIDPKNTKKLKRILEGVLKGEK